MQRIYIDRQDATLKVARGRIHITWPNQQSATSCPLKQVDTIIIAAPTALDSTVLTRLAAAEVNVVCLNRRNHDQSSISQHYRHGNVFRLVHQLNFTQDLTLANEFACSIVKTKIRRQKILLQRMLLKRPDQRLALMTGTQRLQTAILAIDSKPSVDRLMGIEGSAAKQYFEAIASVFPARLEFKGRNRRPPRDPVNALLSLGYTLIHNDCVRALSMAGLDPRLGVLHSLSYGRQSLACDLLEIYRPLYDKLVWRMLAEQSLVAEHFSMDNGACLLNKTGRSHYFPLYETAAKTWRNSQRRQAQHWAKRLDHLYEGKHEQR